jgi:hypothetical protein
MRVYKEEMWQGRVKATLKAISSFFHLETYLFTVCYASGERLKAVP